MYLAAFLVGWGLELAVATPDLPRPAAIAVGLVGAVVWLALDPSAMRRFKEAGTEVPPSRPATALVRGGPYRFSRNPMYLGMLILLVAAGLAIGLLWTIALAPAVFVVMDRAVIPREEAYLERRFGDEYRLYRSEVRRWL